MTNTILTAKTGVFTGLGETVVRARRVTLLVGVGSNDVATRSVVANVEFGVASCGIVVERESASDFRCFAPNQLKKNKKAVSQLFKKRFGMRMKFSYKYIKNNYMFFYILVLT